MYIHTYIHTYAYMYTCIYVAKRPRFFRLPPARRSPNPSDRRAEKSCESAAGLGPRSPAERTRRTLDASPTRRQDNYCNSLVPKAAERKKDPSGPPRLALLSWPRRRLVLASRDESCEERHRKNQRLLPCITGPEKGNRKRGSNHEIT